MALPCDVPPRNQTEGGIMKDGEKPPGFFINILKNDSFFYIFIFQAILLRNDAFVWQKSETADFFYPPYQFISDLCVKKTIL